MTLDFNYLLQVKATKISKQRECNCEKWFVVVDFPYIFLYMTLAQCRQFLKIGLTQPEYSKECLLAVFGEEAVELSGFVKSSLLNKKEKGEIVE